MNVRTLTLVLAVLLPAWPGAPLLAQQVRVSGSVAADDSLQIIGSRLMLSSARPSAYEIYTVPADDFELVMETSAPVYVIIRGESFRLPPLLLEPGTDLRLDADAHGEVEVSGSGTRGPAHLIHEGAQLGAWRPYLSEGYESLEASQGDTDFAAYLAWADSVLQVRNDAVANAGLPPLYARVLQAENLANALRLKGYATSYMDPRAAEALEAEMLRQALSLPGGDTLAYALRYTEAVGNLLDDRFRDEVQALGGTPSLSGLYHFRKSVASSPLLRHVLLATLMDVILRGEDYDAEVIALVDDFTTTVADGAYGVYIEGRGGRRSALAAGQPAPDLAAPTLAGDSITTDDLEGTVTLVTTWGSWCGWSRAELPWIEQVRQRLADEDVTFLYFGWDEDPAAWREAVSAYDLGGVNVLTDEAMRDAWGLVKTPTFILLDRDGSIITVDAPRPSADEGRALEAAIRSALSGQ